LTYVESVFDIVTMGPGISQVRRLPGGDNRNGASPSDGPLPGYGALPGRGALPVLPALGELLPGGLARGSVVAAGRWSLLCLALAAGAWVAGAWCAVAGVPQLGVSAAIGVGLDPARMLLVPDPGTAWPQVVASLLDGCELVLLRPPDRAPATVRRRVEAVLRRCGGGLVVGGGWGGAPGRPPVTRAGWGGVAAGDGRRQAGRVVRGGGGA